MSKKSSSRRWLERQQRDSYVKQAKASGWRSRAVYKLEQIDGRDKLLRPGMTVVDLGAAPGGWTQYAVKRLGGRGTVIGLDILPIEPLEGAALIQGDFLEAQVADQLALALAGKRADLVLCDMAPNLSGVVSADQWRAIELAELARDFALQYLAPDGRFLVKLFQGEGFEAYRDSLRGGFGKVHVRKPAASRAESRELYLLAQGLR